MVFTKTFILSCELFWGYTTIIDLDEVNNIEDIIDIAINNCRGFLKENNLLNLVDKLNDLYNKKKYHIHNYTFEDRLNKSIHRNHQIRLTFLYKMLAL